MLKRTLLRSLIPGTAQLGKLLRRLSAYLEDEKTLQQTLP